MFRPLASLLPGALQRLGAKPQIEAAQVLLAANEFLAPGWTGQAPQATQVRDGVLLVRVNHPAEASLLRQREARLMDALQRRFPGLSLRGMRFRVRR